MAISVRHEVLSLTVKGLKQTKQHVQ